MKTYIFDVDFYTVNNYCEAQTLCDTMKRVPICSGNLNRALYDLAYRVLDEKGIWIEKDSIARPENLFAGEVLEQIILYGADSKASYRCVVKAERVVPIKSSDQNEHFGQTERFDTLGNDRFPHPKEENWLYEGVMFRGLHGAEITAYATPKEGTGIKTPLPYLRRLFAVQLDGKWVIMNYATDENGVAHWGEWLSYYDITDEINESLWDVVETKGHAVVSHNGRTVSICCPDQKKRIDINEHVAISENIIKVFDKLNSCDSSSEE